MSPKPHRRALLLTPEGRPRTGAFVNIHEGRLGGGTHSIVERGSHEGKPVILRRPESRLGIRTLILSRVLNEHLRNHGFPVPDMNALALVEGESGHRRLAHVMDDLTEGGRLEAVTMFKDGWELMPSARVSPHIARFEGEALRHRDRAEAMGFTFKGPEFMLVRDRETKRVVRIAITDTKTVDGHGKHWDEVMRKYIPLNSAVRGELH